MAKFANGVIDFFEKLKINAACALLLTGCLTLAVAQFERLKRDPIGSQSADPVLGHAILRGALDELTEVVMSIDPGA
jgi:hypothetical protein